MSSRCAHTRPHAAPAAALLALFEEGGAVRTVLTRRSLALPAHPGEIALPGGRAHEGEGVVDAALREAWEEVGIDPAGVEVVGWLDRVTGRTAASVATPVVGLLAEPPLLVPDPSEVEVVFTVGLRELVAGYRQEVWDEPAPDRAMHFFELGHSVVWGMTARVLHQLLVVVAQPDRSARA